MSPRWPFVPHRELPPAARKLAPPALWVLEEMREHPDCQPAGPGQDPTVIADAAHRRLPTLRALGLAETTTRCHRVWRWRLTREGLRLAREVYRRVEYLSKEVA